LCLSSPFLATLDSYAMAPLTSAHTRPTTSSMRHMDALCKDDKDNVSSTSTGTSCASIGSAKNAASTHNCGHTCFAWPSMIHLAVQAPVCPFCAHRPAY